jgi:hypothetical protein
MWVVRLRIHSAPLLDASNVHDWSGAPVGEIRMRFDGNRLSLSGFRAAVVFGLTLAAAGCTTIKRTDTARTGLEQLLTSSAIEHSLNKIDWSPIRGAPVFVETKYLDCVDKNYVIVAVHQRLLANHCTLVEKAEDSAVTIELGSGAVGTDRQESNVGIPEISMPSSQIALPRIALFNREKSNGTAKIAVLAYDTKSKAAVINSAASLARSDHSNWSLLGAGPVISGTVPAEIYAATQEADWMTIDQSAIASKGKLIR